MASREPFSRHQSRRDDAAGGADADLVSAYEWAAQEYGWLPDDVEGRLTDEQLVAYFDAARDRADRDADTRFRDRVETARLGYLFAHDAQAYQQWSARQRVAEREARVTDDDVVLAQIARIADLYPGHVIRETLP